jgi:hypothetical protein
MNKAILKQYAEAGVRNRLREMQKELDLLAREFPSIVKNADGSMPSVVPIELKATTGNGNGWGGARVKQAGTPTTFRGRYKKRDQRRVEAAAYLKAHPGATATQIATALGLGKGGLDLFRKTVLQSVATAKRIAPGPTAPAEWYLK